MIVMMITSDSPLLIWVWMIYAFMYWLIVKVSNQIINDNNTIQPVSFFSAKWFSPQPDGSNLQFYRHHCELGPSYGAKWSSSLPAHPARGWHPPKSTQPSTSSCQQDNQAYHQWQCLPIHQTQEVFSICADCYPGNWSWPRLQPYQHNVPENRWWW